MPDRASHLLRFAALAAAALFAAALNLALRMPAAAGPDPGDPAAEPSPGNAEAQAADPGRIALAAPASPLAASPRIAWVEPADGVYRIRNAYNGACLVGSNYDGTDYAWVYAGSDAGGDCLFYLCNRGSGWYTIQAMNAPIDGAFLKAWESYSGPFGKPGTWWALGDYAGNAYCQWGPAVGHDGNWYWVNRAYAYDGILDVLDIAGDYSAGDCRCNVNTDGYDGSNGQTWYLEEYFFTGSSSISGTAKVGAKLTCSSRVTSYNVGVFYHTWYYGNAPGQASVQFAQTSTYGTSSVTVPAAAAGKYITCVSTDNQYRRSFSAATARVTANLGGTAAIAGSYLYAGGTLTCTATGLPAGAAPAYTWYRGEVAGATTERLNTGQKHAIAKADVGKFLTCVVEDGSGVFKGRLIAQGGQATAQLKLTAPAAVTGMVDGTGTAAFPAMTLRNESSCPIALTRIALARAPGAPSPAATLTAGASVLYTAAAGEGGAAPVASPPVMARGASLPLALSLGGGAADGNLSPAPRAFGTITYTAEAA